MRVVLLAAVLGVLLPVASARSTSSARAGCRTHDSGRHAEAVFGHFATRAEALRFRAAAEVKGFKGFVVEDDGCGDFELESDDIETSQRGAFASEAEQSKIQVTWEQVAPPDRPIPGHVVAVFGIRRTITAANALAWRVAGVGFRYVDIVYTPGAWRVVEPGIPADGEAGFRAEARRAKLDVTFARR